MDEIYSKEEIRIVKKMVLAEAEEDRRRNKIVSVLGIRSTLQLRDREIDMVYYKVEKENAPLLIGFHGGGYVLGGCALNDHMWSEISKCLNVNVASVDYRKSPGYQYKEAIDDAYEASLYLKNHAEEYGHNPDNISLIGTSAGAGLAASTCLYAKQRGKLKYRNQILIYPFLDCATNPKERGEGSLDGSLIYIFNELHCKKEDAKLSLVSPVFAEIEELKSLPRAIMIFADKDSLKAEGKKYAFMLRSAGVQVEDMVAQKMPHGYMEIGFDEIMSKEPNYFINESTDLYDEGKLEAALWSTLAFLKEKF